ncbi:MAG: ArsR/SmtB family transcription factor [Thermoleophilia bacterium]
MSMGSSIHSSGKKPLSRQQRPETEYVCDVECIHPDLVEKLEKNAIDWNAAVELSQIFKVMGDPSRLRIISLLREGELCVCDIASALNMTQSAVSHQMRVLRTSRLVRYRREGRVSWYSLDDDHVLKLFTQGLDHLKHTSGEED